MRRPSLLPLALLAGLCMAAPACGRIGYTRVSAEDAPPSADGAISADAGTELSPAPADGGPTDSQGPLPDGHQSPADTSPASDTRPPDSVGPSDAAPRPDVGPGLDTAVLPDAAPDTPCTSCPPVTVTLQGQVETTRRGAGGSGSVVVAICPEHEAVIGFDGTTSRNPSFSYMVGAGARCARLSWSAGSPRITVTPTAMLAQNPGRDGTAWSRVCPADHLIIGWDGRAGDWVNKFTFRCAPLEVSTTGGQTVARWGTIVTLPEVGANAGENIPTTDCPSGAVARGQVTGGNSWLDAFALVCGTPRLMAP